MSGQAITTVSARQANCKQCGKTFRPHGHNPGIYCSIACKAAWQRTQKPVDRDWLLEKYIEEGRSANYIAKIVRRNSKRVWEWLRGYGILTRARGHNHAGNPAFAFWLHGGYSPMKGKRHSDETRALLRKIAIADGRMPFDAIVGPPFRGKRGSEVPSWKGGVTPARQQVYSSLEWKEAVKGVWSRDNATCRRCGKRNSGSQRFAFDVHHIISFAHEATRCDPDNLVLLCEKCHYWVHSSDNFIKLFIKEV